ncbi:MAG: hypothetical protein ACFFCI_04250 [Promethearchaeota archaeon]
MEEKAGKFEIRETLRGSFYASICCIIFCIALLIIVTIAVSTLAKPGFQTSMGTIILIVVWIVIVGLMVYIVLKIRGGQKERSFIIDEKAIIFENPNRPKFEISISDFNTLEVKRIRKSDALDIALNLNFRYSKTIFYRFHFLEAAKSYITESQRDYSRKTLKKIMAALEEFCKTKGKTYIYKK